MSLDMLEMRYPLCASFMKSTEPERRVLKKLVLTNDSSYIEGLVFARLLTFIQLPDIFSY